MNGWIKISRKILEWEHFKNVYVNHVFMTLLLHAYPKPRTVDGRLIEAGQVITSISRLIDITGIKSKNTIINALNTLVQTGEIKRVRIGNESIITICNFELYQGCSFNKQPKTQGCSFNKQPKTQGCSFNKQQVAHLINNLTYINEEDKSSSIERINKEMLTHSIKETGGAPKNVDFETRKNNQKIGYEKYGTDGLVELKPVEHRTLVETFGEEKVRATIEDLNDKIAAGGDDSLNNAKSHFHVLRYWLRYRKDSDSTKPQRRKIDLNALKHN